MLKKWWFWLLLIAILVILYYVLGNLGITPMYRCGSTMGPQGPVNWCQWLKGAGDIVG
jgi:hypothetical protein